MRELTFADATFDVVVSSRAIHNLDESADRIRAFAEIVRVVRPGGLPATVIGRRAGRRLRARGDLVANRCKDALRRQAVGERWEIGGLACDRVGEGVE